MKSFISLALVLNVSLNITHAHTLRVGTLNLHFSSVDRQERTWALQKVLGSLQLDLLLVQEVSDGILQGKNPLTEIQAFNFQSETQWLSRFLGFYTTGNAVLSRFPFQITKTQVFSQYHFLDPKGFMVVKVQVSPQVFWNVVNVHLTSESNPNLAVVQLSELANEIETGPWIIAGDFNLEWGKPTLRDWQKKLGLKSVWDQQSLDKIPSTWAPNYKDNCSLNHAMRAIDHIFYKNLKMQKFHLVTGDEAQRFSDHCLVVSDFEL